MLLALAITSLATLTTFGHAQSPSESMAQPLVPASDAPNAAADLPQSLDNEALDVEAIRRIVRAEIEAENARRDAAASPAAGTEIGKDRSLT
ncbi:MAG TPA: hypothetical protein VL096_13120, partial [Pirellulaceae bacterium]|nr:hypothetical protein [Pirellulaceae bacterium]